MGLVFTTRGWTGAQVLVHHASGDDLFVVSGDVQNAGDIGLSFEAWLDHISRPWSGVVTSVDLDVVADTTGRLVFVITTNSPLDFSGGTPAWQSRIAVSNTSATVGVYGTTRGSCSAVPGSIMWERWDVDIGARNRRGSFRIGHPTLAPRRPNVELAMSLEEAFAFNEALRVAPDPRMAYVFDEVLDDYRMCLIGEASLKPHNEDDPTKVIGTLEVLGLVS